MSSTVSFRALGILISSLPSISVLSFADYVATAARLWPSQGERERESKKLLLVYIVNWVSEPHMGVCGERGMAAVSVIFACDGEAQLLIMTLKYSFQIGTSFWCPFRLFLLRSANS